MRFRFAEKNNLPVLNNVTLPRVGAMKAIMDVLGAPMDINDASIEYAMQEATKQSESNSTIINSEAISKDDDDCGKDTL